LTNQIDEGHNLCWVVDNHYQRLEHFNSASSATPLCRVGLKE
jgi:hypothetical protein